LEASDATPVPRLAVASGFRISAPPAVLCADNALTLLDRAPTDQPWLLWVNFPGPHDPYDPPLEAAELYANADFPPPVNPRVTDQSYRNPPADRRHYAGSCTLIDALCKRILDHLAQTNQLDNTLVVFASDHGDLLGDHGRWAKSMPYEGSVRVPLILAGPGVPQGQTRDDLVELIDLGPPPLAAAHLPPPDHFDARPLPTHGGQPRDVTHSALGDWEMVTDGHYKYARHAGNPSSTGTLWDLAANPPEATTGLGPHADIAARLRAHLDAKPRPQN